MQKRKGFTLVELVIVIAVIAILAGVLIGTFASVINKANESVKLQEIKSQEIEQKADDIIAKINNSNWFSWEDFENSLAEKLTKVYKENNTTTTISSEDLKKAVEESLTTYFANNKVDNTSLTEAQVAAIVENALTKASLGGVTEAQVRTIVNTATKDLASTQLSANQIKSIVNAAVDKGLTAADVAKVVAAEFATQNVATKDQVQNILTALESVAKSSEIEELKIYIDGLKDEMVELQSASANTISAKAFNVVLSKNTTPIKSILDVYDLFENSEYDIQNYVSNITGQTLYYDKQLGGVIIVKDEDDSIVGPDEFVEESVLGHDLFSLNMTIPMPSTVDSFDLSDVTVVASRDTATGTTHTTKSANVRTISATVSNAGEYAWVINQYNNVDYDKANDNVDLEITLTADIDLRGANVAIQDTKGNITIKSSTGNKFMIKNAVNNTSVVSSSANSQKAYAYYACGAIISNAGDLNNSNSVAGEIKFENVIFDSLFVRADKAGNVGILIGYSSVQPVEFKNVTVQNSGVIGHRNVGSLIGAKDSGSCRLVGEISIVNCQVQYIGGRSALIGTCVGGLNCSELTQLTLTGSTLSMYNAKGFDQSVSGTGRDLTITSNKYSTDGTFTVQAYPQKGNDLLVANKQSHKANETTYYYEINPNGTYN